MGWRGSLALDYRQRDGRTIVHDRHDGPLRVLRALYPEGGVCHSVLVHPPGGVVAGDELAIALDARRRRPRARDDAGRDALLSQHRRDGDAVAARRRRGGSRLEWLPLETIAYSGCVATNAMRFELAAGAEMIGWDVLALGLPDSGLTLRRRPLHAEHRAAAADGSSAARSPPPTMRLLDSPLGWAGRRVLATMWFAAGDLARRARSDALLDAARSTAAAHALAATIGATSPQPGVIVVRALAARVEPAMDLLQRIWSAWRPIAWGLDATAPRVWST